MEPAKPRKKKIFDQRSIFFSLIVLLMFSFVVFQLHMLTKSATPGKEDK